MEFGSWAKDSSKPDVGRSRAIDRLCGQNSAAAAANIYDVKGHIYAEISKRDVEQSLFRRKCVPKQTSLCFTKFASDGNVFV